MLKVINETNKLKDFKPEPEQHAKGLEFAIEFMKRPESKLIDGESFFHWMKRIFTSAKTELTALESSTPPTIKILENGNTDTDNSPS